MKTKTTRSYDDLAKLLGSRTSAKSAATVPAAPEKDPTDKGTVTVPGNPDLKTGVPASSSNTDTTATLPAPSPAKTVEGQEPASINMKIAATSAKLRNFLKKAEDKKPEAPTAPAEAGKKDEKKEKAEKSAEAPSAAPEKDPADKGTVEVKKETIGGLPPGEKENTDSKKDASVDLDQTYLAKLASVIMSTERGRTLAEQCLKESFGAEAAQDIVKAAAVMEQAALEQAQLLAEQEAYMQSGAYQAEQMWKSASATEQAQMVKMAKIHELALSKYGDDEIGTLCKMAYDAGAQAAAEEMDQKEPDGDENAQGQEPAGPEEAAGGEVSEEDIVKVLESMIQSGELTPEIAQQLLAEIAGGGEGAEGAEGAPGAAPAPEPEIADMAQKGASIAAKLIV